MTNQNRSRFNADDHTYWDGARRLPSVTEVLKPLYGDLRFVKEDILEYKSALGQAVHKCVELYINGTLDYGTIDPVVMPYFLQYLEFEVDTGFKPLKAEVRVFNPGLGYAGQLDIIGILNTKIALVDLKTTAALSPAVAIQTSAYQKAYNLQIDDKSQHIEKRYALRMTPDKYRLEPYTQDIADFGVFNSLLILHNWCNRTGKQLDIPEYQ